MFQTIDLVDQSSEDGKLCGRLNYLGSLWKISDMPEDSDDTPEPPIIAPDEHMAFEFDFYTAQFTDPGHYKLLLELCGNTEDKDFSEVKVEKNNEGKFDQTYMVDTDVILQDEPMSDVKYEDHKWTFYLPKGNEICA